MFRNKKTLNIVCVIAFSLIMCLMCCFRDLECGTDTLNYYLIYKNDPDNPLREPLYVLSMLLTEDFRSFLIFYAALTYILLGYEIIKEVKLGCFAILIFMVSPNKFFPESFNIIRQSLAGVLILYAFIQWNKQNRLKTFISIVCAIGIHYSSIIAVPFLFIKKMPLRFPIAVGGVLLSLIIGMCFGGERLLAFFSQSLSMLNLDYMMLLASKIDSYQNNVETSSFTYNLSILIPLCLICIFSYPFNAKAKSEYGYYYKIFFLITILANIIIPTMAYGFRFVFSVEYIQLLVIPKAYQLSSYRIRQAILCICGLMILVYLHYLYNMPTYAIRGIVPYKTYW